MKISENEQIIEDLQRQQEEYKINTDQIELSNYKYQQNIQQTNRDQIYYQNFEKMAFLQKILNEFIICQIVNGIALQSEFVFIDKFNKHIIKSKQLLTYVQDNDYQNKIKFTYQNRIITQQLEDSPLIPPAIRYLLNNPFRRQTCLIVLNDLKQYIEPLQQKEIKINVNNFQSKDSLYSLDIIRSTIKQQVPDDIYTVNIGEIYNLLKELINQDLRINGIINKPQICLLKQQLSQFYNFYNIIATYPKQDQKFLTPQFIEDQHKQFNNTVDYSINTGEFALLIYNLSPEHFNIAAVKRIVNILLQYENADIKNNFVLIFNCIFNQILNRNDQLQSEQISQDYSSTGIKVENINEQFENMIHIQHFLNNLVKQYSDMLHFILTINQQLIVTCASGLFQVMIIQAQQSLTAASDCVNMVGYQKLIVNLVNQQFIKQLKQQCKKVLNQYIKQQVKPIEIKQQMSRFGFYQSFERYQLYLQDSGNQDQIKENLVQNYLVQEQPPKLQIKLQQLAQNKVVDIEKKFNQKDVIYENIQNMCKFALNEFQNNNMTYYSFFEFSQEDVTLFTMKDIYKYIHTYIQVNNSDKYHYIDEQMQDHNIQQQENMFQLIQQIDNITQQFIKDVKEMQYGNQNRQREFELNDKNKREKIKISFQNYNQCLESYKSIGSKIVKILEQYNNQQSKQQNINLYKFKLIIPNNFCRDLVPELPQIYQNDQYQNIKTTVFDCKHITAKVQQIIQNECDIAADINNMIEPIQQIEQQEAYKITKQIWNRLAYNTQFKLQNNNKLQLFNQDLSINTVIFNIFMQQYNIETSIQYQSNPYMQNNDDIKQKYNIQAIELQLKKLMSPDLNSLLLQRQIVSKKYFTSKILLGDIDPISQILFQFQKRMGKLREFYDYYKDKYNELLNLRVEQFVKDINNRVGSSIQYLQKLTNELCKNYVVDFNYSQPEKQMPKVISFSTAVDLTQSYNKQVRYFNQMIEQFNQSKTNLNIDEKTGQPIGLSNKNQQLQSNDFCFDLRVVGNLQQQQSNIISKQAYQGNNKQNKYKYSMIILELYIQQFQYYKQIIEVIEHFSQEIQKGSGLQMNKKDIIDKISNYINQLLQLIIQVIVSGLKYLFQFQTYEINQQLIKKPTLYYEVKTLEDMNKYAYSQVTEISNIIKLILQITSDVVNTLQEVLPYETFIQMFILLIRHFICIYVSQLSRFTITLNDTKQEIILIEILKIKTTWQDLYDKICKNNSVSLHYQKEIQNLLKIFDYIKQMFILSPQNQIDTTNIPYEIVQLMNQIQLRRYEEQLQFLDGNDDKIGFLGIKLQLDKYKYQYE